MPRSERYRYIDNIGIPAHDPFWEHIEAEAANRMKPLRIHIREILLDRDRQLYGGGNHRQTNLWFPNGNILERLEEISARLRNIPGNLTHAPTVAPPTHNVDENINEHQALANAAAFANAWDEEDEA